MNKTICLFDEAKNLESIGFAMSPWDISEGIKKPTRGGEKWVNDHKSVEEWKESFYRCHCIAIICGKRSGGVQVIDIDQKNDPTATINNGFKEHLRHLYPDLYDKLYIESTMSGGLHLAFLREGEVPRKSVPAKGADKRALIEVLGEGQLFICAPSKGYTVIQGDLENLIVITDEEYEQLIEVCRAFNQLPDESSIDELKSESSDDCSLPGDDWGNIVDFPKYLESYGWAICGAHDEIVYLRRPGKDSGVSATWNFGGYKRLWIFSSSTEFQSEKMLKPFHLYSKYENMPYKEASKQLRSLGYGDGVDKFKKLFDECRDANEVKRVIIENKGIAKMQGLDWEEVKMHIDAMDIKKVSNNSLDKIKKVVTEDVRKQDNNEDWLKDLERNDDEGIKPKVKNLKTIFGYDSVLCETFKFDVFEKEVHANWNYYRDEEPDWQPIDDDFLGELRIWLSSKYGCDFQEKDILTMVRWKSKAGSRPFHPVKDKINSVEWDGVERVGSWLIKYLGVKDTPYSRKVGQYWMIGALNRIYEPGCQMDYTLIIEGLQGIGKSTFLQKLSLGYFTDRLTEFSNKDAAIELFGNWIIELAELECLKGKDSKKNKSFLSRPFDKIRLPHDKIGSKHLRSNIFVGTTNEDDYLEDGTGNRRYWPVKATLISPDIPIGQLWAEALILRAEGFRHYPERGDKDFLLEQDKRMSRDMRENDIITYMTGLDQEWITLREIHKVVLGNKSDIDWKVNKDLSDLVKKMGMIQSKKNGVRGWRLKI